MNTEGWKNIHRMYEAKLAPKVQVGGITRRRAYEQALDVLYLMKTAQPLVQSAKVNRVLIFAREFYSDDGQSVFMNGYEVEPQNVEQVRSFTENLESVSLVWAQAKDDYEYRQAIDVTFPDFLDGLATTRLATYEMQPVVNLVVEREKRGLNNE